MQLKPHAQIEELECSSSNELEGSFDAGWQKESLVGLITVRQVLNQNLSYKLFLH